MLYFFAPPPDDDDDDFLLIAYKRDNGQVRCINFFLLVGGSLDRQEDVLSSEFLTPADRVIKYSKLLH